MKKTTEVLAIKDGKLTTVKVKATSSVDWIKNFESSYRKNYTEDILTIHDDGRIEVHKNK